MILHSMDTQFKLMPDGIITWQRDLTDPRPGVAVARVERGAHVLTPSCALVTSDAIAQDDPSAVCNFVEGWLARNIQSVLAPLFRMKEAEIATGAPQDIAQKLFDALGILPREELQDLIAAMDEDGRNSLRSRKVRFGPIIVYLPELNKPAMVRLRAMLLSLWLDKSLPAEAPKDGMVSFSVAEKAVDAAYYRAIGYPVYGPRSIRVDMLDRLICRIYDSAVAGKFKAEHQMAEWLGSSIPDLYAVLEAMGHKKIHDPADAPAQEQETSAELQDIKKENGKPDLATFVLKSSKPATRPVSTERADKKKPFNKKHDGKPHKKDNFKEKREQKEPRPKVYKSEGKFSAPADSPFSILQQLKTGQKE